MNDAKIVEAMAGLDNANGAWRYSGQEVTEDPDGWMFMDEAYGVVRRLNNYLASHDAVQWVIGGLSDDELHNMFFVLKNILNHPFAGCFTLKATPRQKCEALLKAKGLWEDK